MQISILILRLRNAFYLFSLLTLITLLMSQQGISQTRWPEGKVAALSITYDDALPSHLAVVAPALEQVKLNATFYITINSTAFTDNIQSWRDLARSGHELGNHSLFHPCAGLDVYPDRGWVTDTQNIKNYSVERMLQELTLANNILKSVDGKSARSYAYPCGDATAGGESYVARIKELFVGARFIRGHPAKITDKNISLYAIPTFDGSGKNAHELIDFVKKVKSSSGYGTITFHGVGGDYLFVSEQDHDEFLAYLASEKDHIWIDTVEKISMYLENN